MGVNIPPVVSTLLSTPWRNTSLAILPILLILHRVLKRPTRPRKVTKLGERVLVLGATSGVGRTIARQYAARGARVCMVGRRAVLLDEVEREYTLVVSAGVSALQPLMAVAGVQVEQSVKIQDATEENIQRTASIAGAALQGNYIGPLVAAVTFIPLLSNTSKAPSIVLINSLASVVPAPTRTLYASTKSASLVLYQALSIEHPDITFTCFMPSTIEGDFRASAVDSGPVRESDPNKHGLKRETVAQRCIRAADYGEKAVFMPGTMRFAHLLYWIWPSLVERLAMKKYNFKV
ncbi:hypothetical protein CPB84DRAFT_1792194 [Gymnopilus junonius]|uniref:NAD(P)-binding protein n=1 Tax=Gymnopilus junonius TaxID=109634 RepID=A0A9P5NCS5_GYMJU|nr:hypothetical protein CPB84DRAFT_1792194 [Gymnopilus junonius]